MPGYRKLGRTSAQRKAMLRGLTTNLLYHGRIVTTVTRAKEIRRIAEKLITAAIKERDNFDVVETTVKTPKKDAKGKRVKIDRNGKRVDDCVEEKRSIKKDRPSRLFVRRKILSALYPVTEVPKPGRKARVSVDMAAKMFNEIAPKYADRHGGYTRIVRLGARKGDGAERALIELI
jgi:large subunit ribosomal protein L17